MLLQIRDYHSTQHLEAETQFQRLNGVWDDNILDA